MKKHLLILLAAVLSTAVSAQLPNGSLAPNFVATDLNGETHELYEYLQEGYTVVLDVSATWCGPCWAYHTGAYNGTNGEGALHVLYNDHGVDNGGSVIVLMIEGDGTTNTECLYADAGCNSSTQGDWVTGTPYPIIDDASIADAYQIGYYPTIYTICPNGIVTETSQITAEEHWAFIEQSSCQQVNANDAIILNYTGTTNSCDVADIIIEIANLGSNTLTDLNITVSGVTPAIDYDWSGNLAMFEYTSLNLGTVTPNEGETVVISITTPDDNTGNNTMQPSVGAVVSTSHIHIELQTDVYPGDYILHIYDEGGTEVVTGGPWADFDVQLDPMLIIEDYYLPAIGCYSVVFEDMYGDGLYDGSYCLVYGIDGSGNDMGEILNVQPGVFSLVEGAAKVQEIVSTIDESEFVSLNQVYPNPTSGNLNLIFTTVESAQTTLEIVNAIGDIAMSQSLGMLAPGQQNVQMDLSHLSAGVYMLNVVSNGNTSTIRITVQ